MFFFDFSGSFVVRDTIDINAAIKSIYEEKIKRGLNVTVDKNEIYFKDPDFGRISYDLFVLIKGGLIKIENNNKNITVIYKIKIGFALKFLASIFAIIITITYLTDLSALFSALVFCFLILILGNIIITRFRYRRFLKKLLSPY